MNGRPSYVFKCSKKMAELALEMCQSSTRNSPMQDEMAYFDGMHRRCEGWKTLTLWTFHPAICRLLRLATVEVKGKTTENISLFWILFNQVLADVNGHSIFFDPKGFLTDEAGANFNGIGTVFGED